MVSTTQTDNEVVSSRELGRPLPAVVDWLAAAIIAIVGMALVVGGSALTFVVDRQLLAGEISAGRITVIVFERELTAAQTLAVTLDVVNWTGIGLLVTGVGLLLVAVWYVLARSRAQRHATDATAPGSYLTSAVLGAVATTVLSFVPFAPVLGGGLAGYLEVGRNGRAVSAGALAGLLAMGPLLAILVFLGIGLYVGLAGIGDAGYGILTAVAMLFAVLVTAAYGAGLSAIGGFLGERLA